MRVTLPIQHGLYRQGRAVLLGAFACRVCSGHRMWKLGDYEPKKKYTLAGQPPNEDYGGATARRIDELFEIARSFSSSSLVTVPA